MLNLNTYGFYFPANRGELILLLFFFFFKIEHQYLKASMVSHKTECFLLKTHTQLSSVGSQECMKLEFGRIFLCVCVISDMQMFSNLFWQFKVANTAINIHDLYAYVFPQNCGKYRGINLLLNLFLSQWSNGHSRRGVDQKRNRPIHCFLLQRNNQRALCSLPQTKQCSNSAFCFYLSVNNTGPVPASQLVCSRKIPFFQ